MTNTHLCEPSLTSDATERLLLSVQYHMSFQVRFMTETPSTVRTDMGLNIYNTYNKYILMFYFHSFNFNKVNIHCKIFNSY